MSAAAMIRFGPLLLPAMLALAGCAVGPDYERPVQPSAGGSFLRAGDADVAAPAARWWEGLNDPQLSGLIETGLRNAPSIAAAQARARQARAGLAVSRAALLPVLSSSATYAYADLPDQAFGTGPGNNELFALGFDAQWEVDLWGGSRRGIERARAEAGAAEARLADAQVSLSAEIARAYVGLRAREASLVLLERRYGFETELVAIAEKRLQGGTGTRQQLAGARQQLEQTGIERAAMAAEAGILRDTLAILTGEAPGALDGLAAAEIPLPPGEVKVGDPATMLARRPDVMAAERRLAAATAQIGVDKASRFPGISLLGLIGMGGTSVSDAFDDSQLSAIALPRLTWNFLDFGRGAAAVRGAKAGRDAALAEYQASVLAALQDAEASLARFGAARIAFAGAHRTAAQAREIERLQEMRAKAGATAPAEALEAARLSVNAALGEANERAGLTLAYVALAKSLGLGWQVAEQP